MMKFHEKVVGKRPDQKILGGLTKNDFRKKRFVSKSF